MRTGRLTAVLSAAALWCGSAAVAAGATGNLPKTDWIVGPINAASSSGVGFCSIKNDFQSGQGLVFARDAEGSNSLAVDFHRKLMETGGQYTVMLTVGSLHREMSAIAATPSVMIIQMGLDHDFYTALQRKASLQIDFETSKLTFALRGASEGFAALTACAQAVAAHKPYPETRVTVNGAAPSETEIAAAAGQEPAAGASGATPKGGVSGVLGVNAGQAQDVVLPSPAPAGESLPLGSRIERVAIGTPPSQEEIDLGHQAATASIRDELEALRAENHRLLLENEAVATRMQGDGDQQLAALQAENRKLKARFALAKDARRQEALEDEVQKLKEALASAEESQPSTAVLTAENQGLKAALKLDEDKLAAARTDTHPAELETENQSLKAELASLKDQAAAAKNDPRIAELTAENEKLKASLAAAAEEGKKVAELQSENQNLKTTLALLAPSGKASVASVAPPKETASRDPVAQDFAPKSSPAQEASVKEVGGKDSVNISQPPVKGMHVFVPGPHIIAQADGFLPALLARAHVRGKADDGAFTWTSSGVKGTAKEESLDGRSMMDAVEGYVQAAGAHCKGDFAHRVSSASNVQDTSIVEGELACMDGQHDASAAVLFISHNGKLDVISHEGAPDKMEKSLAERDAVISAIRR